MLGAHGAISTADSPAPDLTFLYLKTGIAGAIAAAVVLLLWPHALASRWSGATLAAVHLFAIGGLAPATVGALFQFVPVASGRTLAQWGHAEYLVLGALASSAALLATGFLVAERSLLGLGAVLGLTALGLVAGRLAVALWHRGEEGAQVAPIVRGLRASVLGLVGALAIASVLAFELVVRSRQPQLAWVDWHALWAIAGWAGVLIGSVATVIVPMFNVTDAYPARWLRVVGSVPLWLLVGLLGVSLGSAVVPELARAALATMAMAFGVLTLRLLLRSRRRRGDVFRWGWMAASAMAAASGLTGGLAAWTSDARWATAFGVCALAGFAGIAVTTMVYRIVPFLTWLHWQRLNKARVRLPLMHEIIPARPQQIQLALQLAGIAALVVGCFGAGFAIAGALLWLTSQLVLLALVFHATRLYRRNAAQLQRLPPRALHD